jgi:hypothetical protein
MQSGIKGRRRWKEMERDRNDGKGCKVVERDGSVGKERKGIEMMARDGKGCQLVESDGKQ